MISTLKTTVVVAALGIVLSTTSVFSKDHDRVKRATHKFVLALKNVANIDYEL